MLFICIPPAMLFYWDSDWKSLWHLLCCCESFGCHFSSFDLDRRFCHMMERNSSYIWAPQICCVIIFLDSLMYPLNDWKCEYHCFPLVFLRKMIPSECRSLYFCTFHCTLLIAIFYNRCALGLYLSFCDSWFESHLLSVVVKRRFCLRGKIQRIYSVNCSFSMCTHCDCAMVISVVIALRDALYKWLLFYFSINYEFAVLTEKIPALTFAVHEKLFSLTCDFTRILVILFIITEFDFSQIQSRCVLLKKLLRLLQVIQITCLLKTDFRLILLLWYCVCSLD